MTPILMDPADADILPPTRRPSRRRAASVRAARVLVRQLDWLRQPLFWWGGRPPADPEPSAKTSAPTKSRPKASAPATAEPAPSEPTPPDSPDPAAVPAHVPTAVGALAARVRGLPRGAYAVSFVPADATATRDPDSLLAAPSPAEVVPVDEALLARSLRRLMRAPRQFPSALPAVVGDVRAWHDAAEVALKRVRPLIPPRRPTPAELLAIECAAVWLDADDARPSRTIETPTLLALAHDLGAPQFSRGAALVLGQRRVNAELPRERRPWQRCGRAFAAWPLDVLALVAEATRPAELCAAAARDPGLAETSAAHFVREALLVSGADGARRAVENYAALASLIERLCDEPRARLGPTGGRPARGPRKGGRPLRRPRPGRDPAGRGHRRALGGGAVVPLRLRRGRRRRHYGATLQRQAEVPPGAAPSGRRAPRPVAGPAVGEPPVGAPPRRRPARPRRAELAHLLAPQQPRDDLRIPPRVRRPDPLGRRRPGAPPHDRPPARAPVGLRDTVECHSEPNVEHSNDLPPLPVRRETRAELATARERAGVRVLHSVLSPHHSSLGQTLTPTLSRRTGRGGPSSASPWHSSAATWVEACCTACRPGITADAHAGAAFFGLLHLGDSPESLATLAALAPVLTETWPTMKGSAEAWTGARDLLEHRLEFVRAAAAAGLDAKAIEQAIRRNWTHEITAVIRRAPDRRAATLRRLRRTNLDNPPFGMRFMLAGLDGEVLDALADAVAASGRHAPRVLDYITTFFTAGQGRRALEDGRSDKALAARVALVRAVPEVLASLPRFLHDDEKEDQLWAWERAADVAIAWREHGYADPAGVFAALAARDDRRYDENGNWRSYLIDDDPNAVALTLGRRDRLLDAAGLRRELDYQEFAQMGAAWGWLEPLADWRELLSRLACAPRTSARTTRALARLGLCLRLQRGAELRRRLEALLDASNVPAPLSKLLDALTPADELRRDVRRLVCLRGGVVPKSLAALIERPGTLASELHALESRAVADFPPRRGKRSAAPDFPPESPAPIPEDPEGSKNNPGRRCACPGVEGEQRLQRRIDNLRRYLSDPAALRGWIESDLRKLLAPGIESAALDALERLADETVLSHARAVVGSAPPAGYDPRNWDNALRLYFTVEHNRGTLRRLLRGEARGDRSWIREHPANRKFLVTVAKAGVDTDAWTGPFEQVFATPAGTWTVSLETDPLHVLQMGNYFETCLSRDGCNAHATIANACEADKRVAYVRDARGVVIGRKLLLLTPQGRIVGFRSYGAGAFGDWEAHGGDQRTASTLGPWVKTVLDVFSRELADHCRAKLHSLGPDAESSKDGPLRGAFTSGTGLFCHWYNDGYEPFDPPWIRYSPERLRRSVLKGGRARKELKDLLQGEALERSAARRVLLWLGEDGAGVSAEEK